ncbi:MAG TPA: response regulator [Steroidobacteraceae bacterium]|jgi:CheY-like chemotaxis protein|nr:response regulator [Steroidobacteraceae bacterium]
MQSTHNENAANRPPGADADSLLQSSSTAPATILVVEDETLVSFFIRTLLEERGLKVAVAATAAEALQLIEALGANLGAAIIDVGLPDSPGDQLVAPIRSKLPQLPIVIATGFSETEFGRRFQADERVRVIGKPFDAPLLWSALADLDDQFA